MLSTMKSLVIVLVSVCLVIDTGFGKAFDRHGKHRGKVNKARKAGWVKNAFDGMNYLHDFGYVPESAMRSRMGPGSMMKMAIRKFQKMAKITETGEMDNKTMEMMNAPRCGCKDYPDEEHEGGIRKKRFVVQGNKWGRDEVTYMIMNYTPDLTRQQVDDTIRKAFKFWADVTPLSFKQVTQLPADIEIRFAGGDHADGYPFDDEGGVLAHAFPPPSDGISTGLSGDTHFDEAEKWTVGRYDGRNLLYVAVHEFGHSLGLYHSDEVDSIMYPFARGYEPDLKLDADDIAGIQTIYGAPRKTTTTSSTTSTTTSTTTTTTTPKPTTAPDSVCTGYADASTVAMDSRTYIFRGRYVYQLTYSGIGLEPGYPKLIPEVFPNGPKTVDGALTYYNNRVTYLFQGANYWRFSKDSYGRIQQDAGYPRGIKEAWGLDVSDIDAVFPWNDELYFVKGNQYYLHDGYYPVAGNPKHHSTNKALRYLPKINGAVHWTNGKHYFFVDNTYYRWTHNNGNGYMTGPLDTAANWLGCSRTEYF